MILHVTFVTENNGKIQVWYLGRIKNWATCINRKAPMKLPEPSSATEDFYMQHDLSREQYKWRKRTLHRVMGQNSSVKIVEVLKYNLVSILFFNFICVYFT